MTRTALSLHIPDLSAMARHLEKQIAGADSPPGHLALMNMLARAAGFRNFQHFRASALAAAKLEAPPGPEADHKRVEQVLRHFDAGGRLASWPAKTWMQHLALWGLWSHLPAGRKMTEREISAWLNDRHLFDDAAILRRTLAELRLVTRTDDGREYLRTERQPGPDERALIRQLHRRVKG